MSLRKDLQLNKLSVGVRVSLITSAQYRYQGTLAAINSIEGTLTLQTVRFWGSENRLPSCGERKGPAIGSVFDSITFWVSNVIHLHIYDEGTDSNGLGDQAVVKAKVASAAPTTQASGDSVGRRQRSRNRKQKNFWSKKDQPRAGSPLEESNQTKERQRMPTGQSNTTGRISRPGSSRSVGRTLVSYPRRGGGRFPGPPTYVAMPATSFISPTGLRRRGIRGPRGSQVPGTSATNQGLLSSQPSQAVSGFYRFQGPHNGGPPVNGANFSTNNYSQARRGSNRKAGGSGCASNIPDLNHRFTSGPSGVGSGGVFVYVPAEMAAAAYQQAPHSVSGGGPMMGGAMLLGPGPSSRLGNRRRSIRRGGLHARQNNLKETEVDCSTPYDFESANAELEAELAKLSISSDDDVGVGEAGSIAPSLPISESGGQGIVSSTSASTGNGDIALLGEAARLGREVSPSSSAISSLAVGQAMSGQTNADANGASGDNMASVVSSSRAGGATVDDVSNVQTTQLSKGEYYSREKCFFDRISRSEIGLRTTSGICTSSTSSKSQTNTTNGSGTSSKPRARFATGLTGSSTSAGPNNTNCTSVVTGLQAEVINQASGCCVSGGGGIVTSARREHQLNLETFGALAARPFSFGQRYNSHYYPQQGHQYHQFAYRRQPGANTSSMKIPGPQISSAQKQSSPPLQQQRQQLQQQPQQQIVSHPLAQVVANASSSVSSVASSATTPALDLFVTATA